MLVMILATAGAQAGGREAMVTNQVTGKPQQAREGELVVRFRPGTAVGTASAVHHALGTRLQASRPRMGLQLVKLAEGQSLPQVLAQYRSRPDVLAAEPNYIMRKVGLPAPGDSPGKRAIPNDPRYNQLYGMTNIQAPDAWDLQTGDPSVVIAIVDSGINRDHEDLAANTWTNPDEIPGNGIDDDGNGFVDDVFGWDFADGDNDPHTRDESGQGEDHGTHCAGTAGAVGNNGIGVAGVSWHSRLMAVRVLDSGGSGSYFAVASGIEYAAATGANIISMSLGGGYSETLQAAIDFAYGQGCLIVCALGNEDTNITTSQSTWSSPVCNDGVPGRDNKVVGVAAVDQTDRKAWFSNYSAAYNFCDVSAPGVDIHSTSWPSGYATYSGTSMAAPHVSGLAALLWSQYPAASHDAIAQRLRLGADPIDANNPSYMGKLGTGRINAFRSLAPGSPGPAGLAGQTVDDDNLGGSQGNGNGVADPGETIELAVRVRNLGLAGLNGVAGVLSTTTPGVTVQQANSNYGDLPAGNALPGQQPYVVQVGAGVAEGTDMAFNLRVTATNGGPYDLPFTVHVGRDQWGEPDDTFQQAFPLPTNGTLLARRLEVPGDQDWFVFAAQQGNVYTLETSNLGDLRGRRQPAAQVKATGDIHALYADTVIELYGPDGTTLLAENDDGGVGLASKIEFSCLAAGNYYLKVRGFGSSVGTYSVSAVERVATPGPVRVAGEVLDDDNNGASQGNGNGTIDPGEIVEVTVSLRNEGQATLTNARATLTTSTPDVVILQAQANYGDLAPLVPGAGQQAYVIQVGAGVTVGTLIACELAIQGDNGGPFTAPLTLGVGRDSWGEPDDTPVQAAPIATNGVPVARRFEVPGDVDWFRFEAAAGQDYVLETSNLGNLGKGATRRQQVRTKGDVRVLAADTVLYLYGPDGTTLLDSDDDGGGGLASRIDFNCPAAGTYYARILDFWGDVGTYSFSIRETTLEPGPFELWDVDMDELVGNGNGICDPGEQIGLSFLIFNAGQATLNNALGTLTCRTPGVTILSEPYPYGNIGPGGAVDNYADPFVVEVGAAIPEGTGLQFSLTVNGDNGGPYTMDFEIFVGRDPWGEPDDTFQQACPVVTDGRTYNRRFEVDFDTDWFRFYALAGEQYVIETFNLGDLANSQRNRQAAAAAAQRKGLPTSRSGPAKRQIGPRVADTWLDLYDQDGTTLLLSDDDGGDEQWSSRITWTAPVSGYYYILATEYDYWVGTYSIRFTGAQPTQHRITGRVTDDQGAGLEGVQIRATSGLVPTVGKRTVYNALTDAQGNYTLTNLPPETYVVQALSPDFGFTPDRHRVTLPPNAVDLNFQATTVPAPTKVEITPAEPGSRDDLTAQATGGPEGATYEYEWVLSSDGGTTWGEWDNPGATLPASATHRGDWWKARGRCRLIDEFSGWVESQPVQIRNASPTAPQEVFSRPNIAGVDQDLTGVARRASDPDGDRLTYNFEWSRSTDGGTTWSPWGWPGAVLPAAETAQGDRWKVRAQASDGVATSPWFEGTATTVTTFFVGTSPARDATEVHRRNFIVVSFRWPVIMGSLEQRFSVKNSAGDPVEGTLTWLRAFSRLKFTPTNPLQVNEVYTVAVAAGTRRKEGTPVTWPESFSFTTGAQPVIGQRTPLGQGVSLGTNLTATFDMAMHRVSVENNFTLTPAAPGTFSWVGSRMIFTPNAPLTPGTAYRATIGPRARSADGVEMGKPVTWAFTTSAGAASVGLVAAAATTPAGGAQVTLSLASSATVQVQVCNLAGRPVALLPPQSLPAGMHTLVWNGRSTTGTTVPSGLYLLRVRADAPTGASAQCLLGLRLQR
jgi:subtilisin family serine protease